MSEGVLDYALVAQEKVATEQNALGMLITRLCEQHQFILVDEGNLEALTQASGDMVLLLTEDVVRSPETWDVAIVLPEILKLFGGRLKAAIADTENSKKLQARFGTTRFPAMVFLRDGEYVDVIQRMLDWDEFVAEVTGVLEKPVGRAPTIGIPVRNEVASSCH